MPVPNTIIHLSRHHRLSAFLYKTIRLRSESFEQFKLGGSSADMAAAFCEALHTVGAPADGLCGRILRGKSPADFSRLTSPEDAASGRDLVLVMGADGLASLSNKSGYEMLCAIGYTKDGITAKLAAGYTFRLLVFPADEALAPPATWRAFLSKVAESHPEWREKLERHRAELEACSWDQLADSTAAAEAALGHDIRGAFSALSLDATTVAHVRALLKRVYQLNELFTGDGFTFDESTRSRGCLERVVQDCEVGSLGGSLMELMVRPPAVCDGGKPPLVRLRSFLD